MPTKDDEDKAKASNRPGPELPRDLLLHGLGPFLSIADIATKMKPTGHALHSFFRNVGFFRQRLARLGVPPEQIAVLDPNTIEIITHQLEELKKNSPTAFKQLKQNYLDTGIPCPAVFSLQVAEGNLTREERQKLSDQAAQYNNVTLLHYLSSEERGANKTPLQTATLSKACLAGNLSLVKALLDPVAGRMDANNRGHGLPTPMMALSQNFSVMQWVLEALAAEPGNPALKQKIKDNIPLDPVMLSSVAVVGGKVFYTQLSQFLQEHPNSFPEIMESLGIANYCNDLMNNGRMDDFSWISDANDPRMQGKMFFMAAAFKSGNLQLVANLLEATKNLGGAEYNGFLVSSLQLALIYSPDPAVLGFIYNQQLEEYRRSLPNNGVEVIDIDEQFKTHFRDEHRMSFEDMMLMPLIEQTLPISDSLVEKLKIVHMKPTMKQVAMAVNGGAYHLAATLCSDSLGENKVMVTREGLQAAAAEDHIPLPKDDILDKLFHFQPAAPAP